jgi:hypothetical protein
MSSIRHIAVHAIKAHFTALTVIAQSLQTAFSNPSNANVISLSRKVLRE